MIRKIGVNNVEVVLHNKAEFQASMGELMSYHWITFWYCKITWLINEIFLTAKWQSYKSENAKKIAAHHGKSFKKKIKLWSTRSRKRWYFCTASGGTSKNLELRGKFLEYLRQLSQRKGVKKPQDPKEHVNQNITWTFSLMKSYHAAKLELDIYWNRNSCQ